MDSDVKELITLLNKLRSLLSDSAQLARKPVQRKLNDISNDAKADPELLALAQAAKSDGDISRVVTQCNIGLCKTRALMIVAGQEEGKN